MLDQLFPEDTDTQAKDTMADARLAMSKEGFYDKAEGYWKNIPATVDGMLGGFSHISDIDVAGSQKFLNQVLEQEKSEKPRLFRALDCGAGIGRVSKHFLLKNFQYVDLLELTQSFLDKAKTEYLGEDSGRVEKYICMGLQHFIPEPKRYNVVWCQWVMGHLNDDHFVRFLKRCKDGLTERGLVFIKENTTDGIDLDTEDSSVTRSDKPLRRIFRKAGFIIIKDTVQTDFPATLYPVKMYALKPEEEARF